jgi:hypothetical protein
MEQLPYIDVHEVEVAADVDATWQAVVGVGREALGGTGQAWLGRVLAVDPPREAGEWSPEPRPGAALSGFAVEEVRPGEVLSLRGSHRFARYRLDFELAPADGGRSRLRARSWAEFPGLGGAVYRTLVIRSGGHRLIVRRLLRQVATAARTTVATGPAAPEAERLR